MEGTRDGAGSGAGVDSPADSGERTNDDQHVITGTALDLTLHEVSLWLHDTMEKSKLVEPVYMIVHRDSITVAIEDYPTRHSPSKTLSDFLRWADAIDASSIRAASMAKGSGRVTFVTATGWHIGVRMRVSTIVDGLDLKGVPLDGTSNLEVSRDTLLKALS